MDGKHISVLLCQFKICLPHVFVSVNYDFWGHHLQIRAVVAWNIMLNTWNFGVVVTTGLRLNMQ